MSHYIYSELSDEDQKKLSGRLLFWRSERPDEWTMDELIRSALSLEQQRDELLAALEDAHKLIDAVCPFEGAMVLKIEKAIAKAKGGAA